MTALVFGAGSLVPALVCGGGMALCMWMASRGSRHGSGPSSDGRAQTPADVGENRPDQDARIAALEEEVRRMRAQETDDRQR